MVWTAVAILSRLNARLRAEAHTDGLTGLLNRTGFVVLHPESVAGQPVTEWDVQQRILRGIHHKIREKAGTRGFLEGFHVRFTLEFRPRGESDWLRMRERLDEWPWPWARDEASPAQRALLAGAAADPAVPIRGQASACGDCHESDYERILGWWLDGTRARLAAATEDHALQRPDQREERDHVEQLVEQQASLPARREMIGGDQRREERQVQLQERGIVVGDRKGAGEQDPRRRQIEHQLRQADRPVIQRRHVRDPLMERQTWRRQRVDERRHLEIALGPPEALRLEGPEVHRCEPGDQHLVEVHRLPPRRVQLDRGVQILGDRIGLDAAMRYEGLAAKHGAGTAEEGGAQDGG